MTSRNGLYLLFSFLLCVTPSLAALDAATICPSPQPLGSPTSLLGTSAGYSAMAWNGKEFAAIWLDNAVSGIRFQRFFANGKPAAPALTIASGVALPVGIVWNGSGYGVVYGANFNSLPQVYFARLDANGTIITGPTRISNYFSGAPTQGGYYPAIAWSGNGYAVVFCEYPGNYDVYAALLDVNGIPAYVEIPVGVAGNDQVAPSVVWSPTTGTYVVAWHDSRSGVKNEIATGRIYTSGTGVYNGIIVSAAGSSISPWLASNGSSLGMSWYDSRDGNYEIYFATLTPAGYKVGADVRVTNDGATSYNPQLTWIGGEYGLFWFDSRGSGWYDLWYQRVSSSGSVLGSPTSLTYGTGVNNYAAAFGAHGYLVAFNVSGPQTLLPWGCNYPYPPGCPEAPDAYGVTGSGATISWLSGTDPYTDIAYYQVFRNNALVGTTANTFLNDTGLSPNTTYQYNIRTVNAADLFSAPCPGAQIYVKSSSALSLSVDKSPTDIGLSWTDSSGQNTYRVMRGTSPQTMAEIDRTSGLQSTDRNAAVGNVCYFYSIDVPQN